MLPDADEYQPSPWFCPSGQLLGRDQTRLEVVSHPNLFRTSAGSIWRRNIHDGWFKGEVVFSTFSSSNPF